MFVIISRALVFLERSWSHLEGGHSSFQECLGCAGRVVGYTATLLDKHNVIRPQDDDRSHTCVTYPGNASWLALILSVSSTHSIIINFQLQFPICSLRGMIWQIKGVPCRWYNFTHPFNDISHLSSRRAVVNLLFQWHGFRKLIISEPGQKDKKWSKPHETWACGWKVEGWKMEGLFGCWFACWLCAGVGRCNFASAHLLRFFCIDEFLFLCAFFCCCLKYFPEIFWLDFWTTPK